MRDYDDPLSLNKTTSLTDYNCYGFAFHSLEWEEPKHYDLGQEPIEMVQDCIEDILTDHPEYKLCGSYKDIPINEDVVGFRISVYRYVRRSRDYETGVVTETESENDTVGDFHFILRHKGKWYHKPGSWAIQEVDFEVEEPWPHHDRPYNSEIVWFTRG